MSYDFIVFLFAPAEGPMCDFCSGTPVVATHCCSPSVMARGVKIGSFTWDSEDKDGLWAACAGCDHLIRSENWDILLRSSINSWEYQYGTKCPLFIRDHIKECHQQFISTRRRDA